MRFSLRNKVKIEKALGKTYLELLQGSLKAYFTHEDIIKEHFYPNLDNEKGCQVIHVPSSEKGSNSIFEFVITCKKYDVYNLAYYSVMG